MYGELSIYDEADDVARELNCSKSHAYKLVKAYFEKMLDLGYEKAA